MPTLDTSRQRVNVAGLCFSSSKSIIGPDKEIYERKIVIIFLSIILKSVSGAQKNHLIELVLLSTHNIWFGREMKKIFFQHRSYLEAWDSIPVI